MGGESIRRRSTFLAALFVMGFVTGCAGSQKSSPLTEGQRVDRAFAQVTPAWNPARADLVGRATSSKNSASVWARRDTRRLCFYVDVVGADAAAGGLATCGAASGASSTVYKNGPFLVGRVDTPGAADVSLPQLGAADHLPVVDGLFLVAAGGDLSGTTLDVEVMDAAGKHLGTTHLLVTS